MKRQKAIFCFKHWQDKFKKIKSKEVLLFLILISSVILVIVFSGFYFKYLVDNEMLEMKKDLERIIWQLERKTEPPEKIEQAHPETLHRLRETGVERYFLSDVKLIGFYYTPVIHACLFEEGRPIHPFYIYETWSMVDYPEPSPEIALVRYLLLPEDNSDFQPERNCYIKKIKTEQDWRELEEKYGFSRDQFSTRPQN